MSTYSASIAEKADNLHTTPGPSVSPIALNTKQVNFMKPIFSIELGIFMLGEKFGIYFRAHINTSNRGIFFPINY